MLIDSPLVGSKVRLAPLSAEAAHGRYGEWMRDPEVLQYLEARFGQHTPQSLEAFITRVNASADSLLLGIVDKVDDQHVGNIKLGPINPHHGYGDIGIIVGERNVRGRGLATEAIALLTAYAFGTLGLHRLTAGCYGNNPGSLRAFEKCGFQLEGCRPAHYRSGGEWVDGLLLGILNPSERQVP